MKRLLLFVVLLAAGLTALKFAIGEEDAVRQTSADPEEKTEQQREPATPPGVRVNSGKINTTVSQSGKLVFPKRREVDLGDGTVRKETVFVLRAEDSRPIGDGLQQLTDVRLELFDDNEHAATVIASRAFLELGRDANGEASSPVTVPSVPSLVGVVLYHQWLVWDPAVNALNVVTSNAGTATVQN